MTYKDTVKATFAKYKGSGKSAPEIMKLASAAWRAMKGSKGGALPNDVSMTDPEKFGGKFNKSQSSKYKLVSESPVNARPVQLGADTEMPKSDTTDFKYSTAKLEKIAKPEFVGQGVQERQMFGGARRPQPGRGRSGVRQIDAINPRQTGKYDTSTPASLYGAGWFDDAWDSVKSWGADNADWLVPTAIALL